MTSSAGLVHSDDRKKKFEVLEGLLRAESIAPGDISEIATFANTCRQGRFEKAERDVLCKVAAHGLARYSLAHLEATSLYEVLFPVNGLSDEEQSLQPLRQLSAAESDELRRRWTLLAIVLPCSAVDLVCYLLQRAQKDEFMHPVGESFSDMHLYKAVLIELASYKMDVGVVTDQVLSRADLDLATSCSRNHVGTSIDSASARSAPPSETPQTIESRVTSFAQQSLQTHSKDCIDQLRATLSLISTMDSRDLDNGSTSVTPASSSAQTNPCVGTEQSESRKRIRKV